jgi:hypothetical protein
MSAKKAKANDRAQILEHIRAQLVEHFDIGFLIVSWTTEGQTMEAHAAFGNSYALENLSEKAKEILFPEPDEDEEEDIEA